LWIDFQRFSEPVGGGMAGNSTGRMKAAAAAAGCSMEELLGHKERRELYCPWGMHWLNEVAFSPRKTTPKRTRDRDTYCRECKAEMQRVKRSA
jgi:hypothetical protein